jgi:hypothetical protein
MITITKQITLNPGVGETGPYVYTWSADTPASGCVSFSPSVTGVIANPASQTIQTNISFFNETCLEDTTITLSITYNAGECTKVFPITLTNPCDDLEIGTITVQTLEGYFFSAAPTGGDGPYTYNWYADPTYFAPIGSSTANTFRVGYIGSGQPPLSSTVSLTVMDANGCSDTATADFSICALTFDNINKTTVCNPDATSSVLVCLDPIGCARSLVDWDSFNYTASAAGITMTQVAPSIACTASGGRRFRIDIASTVTAGNYTISYSASTTNGIISNTATIYLTIPSCAITPVSTIVIEAISPIQITCDYSPTDIYEIGPLTSYVQIFGSSTIDWSTFSFVDLTTGADEGAGPLTTPLAGVVTFNPSTLNIEYEIPAATGTDSFRWTVCDSLGNCAQSQVYAIVLDCVLTPEADDDTECATCGVTAEHDVLDNDTINGILFYLEVTTAPSFGSATFNGSYASPRILYTPNATYSGADSYVYTLTNDSGQTDTATVTVNVLCAGVDANISVCE